MSEIRIDGEFKKLIKPLSEEEFAQLEQNVLRDGIRDPLVVWAGEGILLDGHNRYALAEKHNLRFETKEVAFGTREEAEVWIIDNQLGRRNLEAIERIELAERRREVLAARARERQSAAGKEHGRGMDNAEIASVQMDTSYSPQPRTRDTLAKTAGVSSGTMARYEEVKKKRPDLLEEVRRGELTIGGAYKAVKQEERGELPTEPKKAHVAYNSGQNEWYTPKEYIDAARKVMGSIDLDPASSEIANRTVQATEYYTEKTDGLAHAWHGNVWMNPPYSSDKIGRFADKLVEERENIGQAIVLVNNATETAWFRAMVGVASAVCFPGGRVKFLDPEGNPRGAPLQGQAVIYVGEKPDVFCKEFSQFGWTAVLT